MTSKTPRSLWAVLCTLLQLSIPLLLRAESGITVTTNYYTVTGSNSHEIRAALAQARPWKTNQNYDASTKWSVEWRYHHFARDGQFRLDAFTTQTKVVVILPRWLPPAQAPAELVQRWNQYLGKLWSHEAGHIKLARAATAEIQREVTALGSFASSQELADTVKRTASGVLDKYRRHEREYDQQTFHGAAQGAQFQPR